MTTLKRRAAAISAPLLLAVTLTACGGGASGAPDDASVEDFCDVFLDDSGSDIDPEDNGALLDAIQEQADRLADVGTPEDFDEEAREGFEVFVDVVSDFDEGDIEDLDSADPGDIVSEEDADKVTAFTASDFGRTLSSGGEACTPELDDLEDELGDLEDQLPSEPAS